MRHTSWLLCGACCLVALACAVAATASDATATPPPQAAHHNNKNAADDDDDLPAGVMRGPLLHEHSLQSPLVNDWWDEGVPHFMLGGSAVATERLVRLTSHELDAHGFVFNTAPLDHDDWELRLRVSVRPPPPAVAAATANTNNNNNNNSNSEQAVHYEGGDGMALWYLQQPIGDDHQHVVKYSKSLSPAMMAELLDAQNPWRAADLLLNDDVDDDDDTVAAAVDDDDGVDEADLTTREKEARALARERRALKRRKREELYRRLFKRGTSIDDTAREPRIMGVKYTDFAHGFALVLDSVGADEAAAAHDHNDTPTHDTTTTTTTTDDDANRTQQQHAHAHAHRHTPSVYLLLNVPQHEPGTNASIVNNFDASGRRSFRHAPRLLHCDYNFRQAASRKYVRNSSNATVKGDDAAHALLHAPEEPLEVVVRYYKKKLSVLLRREKPQKRTLLPHHDDRHDDKDMTTATAGAGGDGHDTHVDVRRTYVETLCGELYPVHLPRGYYLGLSASTGHRNAQQRRLHARLHHGNYNDGAGDDDNDYYDAQTRTQTHVDVHDVLQLHLRELGKDAKAMGYSKTVPLEHFDFDRDAREREHFSRRIPDAPDEEGPPY